MRGNPKRHEIGDTFKCPDCDKEVTAIRRDATTCGARECKNHYKNIYKKEARKRQKPQEGERLCLRCDKPFKHPTNRICPACKHATRWHRENATEAAIMFT